MWSPSRNSKNNYLSVIGIETWVATTKYYVILIVNYTAQSPSRGFSIVSGGVIGRDSGF